MKAFGTYLRDARKRAGLSQRTFASSCGIDISYVSKLENGRLRHTPSAGTLSRMATALGIDELDVFSHAGKLVGPLAQLSERPGALQVMRVATERIDSDDGWDALLRYVQSEEFGRALEHPGSAERG
jgi:transcriptional regulator with XRE-family HTH domain